MNPAGEQGDLGVITSRLEEIARELSEPGLDDERVAELAAEAAELASRAGEALARARDAAREGGPPAG